VRAPSRIAIIVLSQNVAHDTSIHNIGPALVRRPHFFQSWREHKLERFRPNELSDVEEPLRSTVRKLLPGLVRE